MRELDTPTRARPEGRRGSSRRRLLAAVAAVGVVLAAVAARTALRDERPNVVLVVIDALRRDHVGAYGHHVATTPFLDELGRSGVVFENAWSHAPQTFNATAALLTGRLFPLLRVQAAAGDAPTWTDRRIAGENATLAEAFRDGGYDTLAVFTNPHHAPSSGFAQGFRRHRWLAPEAADQPYAVAPEVNEAFRELVAEREPDRPFFAYVHYMDVHNPYRPPADLARLFVTAAGEDKYRNGLVDPSDPPRDEDVRFMIETYDACIRWVDDHVRDLARMLDGASPKRPTVLVVTSDHGDEFLDHGGFGHGHSMHTELLRVPLIVHGRALPSGVRVKRLARGIDVGPTLAALARVAPPAGSEGASLLPAVAAASRGDAPPVPARIPGDDAPLPPEGETSFAWTAHLRALTTEDFHLTLDASTGAYGLWRVSLDRAARPRVPRAARRRIKRAMRLKVDDYERRLSDVEAAAARLPAEVHEPDAGVARQLRALGYVE